MSFKPHTNEAEHMAEWYRREALKTPAQKAQEEAANVSFCLMLEDAAKRRELTQ